MIKIATIGLLTASLAGCMNPVKTNASLEWDRYIASVNADVAAYVACNKKFDAELNAINEQMDLVLIAPGDSEGDKIKKKINPSTFTAEQKELLLWFADLPCSEDSVQRMLAFDPSLAEILNESMVNKRLLITKALKGDITVGEYNTEREDVSSDLVQKLNAQVERKRVQLLNQHNQEYAAKQQRDREVAERIRKANAESNKMIMDMMTEQRRQMMLQQGVVTECKDTTFGGAQASVTCTSKPGF